MKAKDIMTSPVVSVELDATIMQAAQIMLQKRISGLPVVDKDGHLVGIVTEGDRNCSPPHALRNSVGIMLTREIKRLCYRSYGHYWLLRIVRHMREQLSGLAWVSTS